jgi:two-component sensor histidine kinase
MRHILHSRLPQRVRSRWAAAGLELAIGIGTALVFVGARIAFDPYAGDRGPYALNYFAVCLAAVLAGWRAGVLSVLVGQGLTWSLVVPHAPGTVGEAENMSALLLASGSQLLIVLLLALYQREIDKGVAEREKRLTFMEEARREIDHRVGNYLQTILSLVQLQSQRAGDPATREALGEVAGRIVAISVASSQLSARHDSISTVRLRDHLSTLCEELSKGLTWDGMQLKCDIADVQVPSTVATYLGVIVNELVTNALKHAFSGERGGVVTVSAEILPGGLQLIIADDGQGMGGEVNNSGLGRRLVASFVRELGAEHKVSSSPKGTRHRIIVPDSS